MKASAKGSVTIICENSGRKKNKAGISPHLDFWEKNQNR
jgi:hypothetical protein